MKQEPAPGPAERLHHPPCPGLGRGEPARQKQTPMGVAKGGLQNVRASRFGLQAWKGLGCSAPLVCLGLFISIYLSIFFWPKQGWKAWFFPTRGVFFACNGWAFPASVLPSSGTSGFFLQLKVCKQESRAGEGVAGHTARVPHHRRSPASPGLLRRGWGAGSILLTSSACIP